MATKKTTTKKAAGSKATKATKPKAKADSTPQAAPAKAKGSKPKRVGALDAAVTVLGESKHPMNCKQMVDAMAAKGYWNSPNGKTPHATLYSAILRDIQKGGKNARFTKVERGQFTLAKGA